LFEVDEDVVLRSISTCTQKDSFYQLFVGVICIFNEHCDVYSADILKGYFQVGVICIFNEHCDLDLQTWMATFRSVGVICTFKEHTNGFLSSLLCPDLGVILSLPKNLCRITSTQIPRQARKDTKG